MNRFFNLLYPDVMSVDTETVISSETVEDLGFDDVMKPFKNTERYYEKHKTQLNKILTLEYAITYRQEVFLDFLQIPGLKEELNGFLPNLYQCIREYEEYNKAPYDPVRDMLWKTELFDLYSTCLSALSSILYNYQNQIQSQGFKNLQEQLKYLQEQPEYMKAKESLPTIREKIKDTGSFSLNIHFNIDYKPFFTTVTKPQKDKNDSWTIAKALFGIEDQKQAHSIMSDSVPGLKTLYDQTFKKEMQDLAQEASIVAQAFSKDDFLMLTGLDYGFDFYLAAIKFTEYWKQKEIDLCMPVVCLKEENTGVVHGMTDLGLAYQMNRTGHDPFGLMCRFGCSIENRADRLPKDHVLAHLNPIPIPRQALPRQAQAGIRITRINRFSRDQSEDLLFHYRRYLHLRIADFKSFLYDHTIHLEVIGPSRDRSNPEIALGIRLG